MSGWTRATCAMRERTWLASTGSGAPHHKSRSACGTGASSTAASDAQRPSCHMMAGISGPPSAPTKTWVLTYEVRPTAATAASGRPRTRSASAIPTCAIQSSGFCPEWAGRGRKVGCRAEKHFSATPPSSNSAPLTDVVPTSRAPLSGPYNSRTSRPAPSCPQSRQLGSVLSSWRFK